MGKSPSALAEHSREWQTEDGSWWIADTTWVEIDGRAECVSVNLSSCRVIDGEVVPTRAAQGARPIRSAVVRSFPMSMLADIRRNISEMLGDDGPYMDNHSPAERQDIARPFERPGRRGIKLTGPNGTTLPAREALAEVARVYLDEIEAAKSEGRPARPNVIIGEHFGMSAKAASRRVARAREIGFLTPTIRGSALGPK
jgi:hypothetical protein